MQPCLKWNKIILAWIFMRQLFTQLQHLSTVIARCCLQAPDWTRPWTPPTMTQTHLNSADVLKWYFACTEVLLQKTHVPKLISYVPKSLCTKTVHLFVPKLSCTRYRKRANPCGLSADLECRCEMCCTRIAGNAGHKKSPSGYHRTTLWGQIFATKARIDNRKKNLLNNNFTPHVHNMAKFGPLMAEITVYQFGASLQILTGFASWQRYCMAL